MSTPEGHSALHALHERQRSSASRTRSSEARVGGEAAVQKRPQQVGPPAGVECSSSRVAMNDGHIVPASSFRQTPAPLQSSTAPAKPFSRG